MRIALFVTCLIDSFRPGAGFASLKLLEDAGCEVEVPLAQTCCGQPAYNSGDADNARAIARQVIDTFADYTHVVIPSGSCAGMMIKHYPQLFEDDPHWQRRARDFAARCYELLRFLSSVLEVRTFPVRHEGVVTYHASCSSLRETYSTAVAHHYLREVAGENFHELPDAEVCCGFGGTFAVKYGDISTRIVDDKLKHIESTGAATLVSADLGCLLNIAGRMSRQGKPTRVFHIAELLAGMTDAPAIGEPQADEPA